VTAGLRQLYIQAAHGRLEAYRHWLMPVYEPVGQDCILRRVGNPPATPVSNTCQPV
jgi:hypothetical protein